MSDYMKKIVVFLYLLAYFHHDYLKFPPIILYVDPFTCIMLTYHYNNQFIWLNGALISLVNICIDLKKINFYTIFC